jgi:FKBP-type peptidyl-prolyl cis-trans isomerase FkpA
VGVQYVLYNLTNTTLESATTTDGTAAATFSFYSTIPGFYAALRHVKAGSTISFILPSGLAYGATSYTVSSSTIPAFSCLRFDLSLVSVSN